MPSLAEMMRAAINPEASKADEEKNQLAIGSLAEAFKKKPKPPESLGTLTMGPGTQLPATGGSPALPVV